MVFNNPNRSLLLYFDFFFLFSSLQTTIQFFSTRNTQTTISIFFTSTKNNFLQKTISFSHFQQKTSSYDYFITHTKKKKKNLHFIIIHETKLLFLKKNKTSLFIFFSFFLYFSLSPFDRFVSSLFFFSLSKTSAKKVFTSLSDKIISVLFFC